MLPNYKIYGPLPSPTSYSPRLACPLASLRQQVSINRQQQISIRGHAVAAALREQRQSSAANEAMESKLTTMQDALDRQAGLKDDLEAKLEELMQKLQVDPTFALLHNWLQTIDIFPFASGSDLAHSKSSSLPEVLRKI